MEKGYLTIKKFADLVGVSPQSIYKRLGKKDDEIQGFVLKEDKKTFISEKAIKVIYNINIEASDTVEEEEAKKEAESVSPQLLKVLQKQIESQQKEIEEKNRQIERLQESLLAEQQLHLIANKRILTLEEAKREEKKEIVTNATENEKEEIKEEEAEEKSQQTAEPKKGFFSRLFKK